MTGPARATFSVTTKAAGPEKTGAESAPVLARASADQALSPSSFSARTCTSYSVSGARPAMVAHVPATSCGPSPKLPTPLSRYWRS